MEGTNSGGETNILTLYDRNTASNVYTFAIDNNGYTSVVQDLYSNPTDLGSRKGGNSQQMAVTSTGIVFLIRTPLDVTDPSDIGFELIQVPSDGSSTARTWRQNLNGINDNDFWTFNDRIS